MHFSGFSLELKKATLFKTQSGSRHISEQQENNSQNPSDILGLPEFLSCQRSQMIKLLSLNFSYSEQITRISSAANVHMVAADTRQWLTEQ